MSAKIRIAVVGLGWVALARHIPALLRSDAFELVGVIDRHPGLAARIAKRFALAHAAQTDDLATVDWLGSCEALTIAAPPMAHAKLALAALKRGLHVLTEKPFAMDEAEGSAMAEAASQAHKIIAVVHNFQFSRAAKRLEQDLATGKLGTLRRIAATQLGNPARRLPTWYERLPMGLFYDESPHFFYLLRKLAGPSLKLEHAYAVPSSQGLNTPALIQLAYLNETGLPISMTCDFESAVSEWHIMVTGTQGLAILDIFRDIYIRLPNDGAHGAWQILRTSLAACLQHLYHYIPNGLALARGRLDYGNDELYRRFAQALSQDKEPQQMGVQDALAILHLQHEAISALKGAA